MLEHIIPEFTLKALGDSYHDTSLYEAGQYTGNYKACGNKYLMCQICECKGALSDARDIDIHKRTGEQCSLYSHAEHGNADTYTYAYPQRKVIEYHIFYKPFKDLSRILNRRLHSSGHRPTSHSGS